MRLFSTEGILFILVTFFIMGRPIVFELLVKNNAGMITFDLLGAHAITFWSFGVGMFLYCLMSGEVDKLSLQKKNPCFFAFKVCKK